MRTKHDDLGIDNDTGEVIELRGDPDSTDAIQRDEYILMRTMTLKNMGCGGGLVVNAGERIRLAQIWGRVDSWLQVRAESTDVNSEMLDVVCGVFRGINCITGAKYEAPNLALPGAFQPSLVREISSHGTTFEFLIEIVGMPAANPSGYSYIGRMKLDTKSEDALADMQKRWGITSTVRPMIALRSDPAPLQIA